MNTDMTPVPVGTRVRYHGSLDYLHGEYVVTAHTEPRSHPSAYVDGTAYTLWEADVDLNVGEVLRNTRRTSFTVVE